MNFTGILQQYGLLLLEGAGMTLLLTGLSACLAALVALPVSILRHGGGLAAQVIIRIYISFFRGTPLLVQLFLVYYGSGQFRAELQAAGLWAFFSSPFNCAVLTLTLNSIAYQTEILRGGLQGTPRGEVEAANAIGMSRWLCYRRVILPHTWRIALPALGNEVILLMKGSALASVITILDLMGQTRVIFARTFDFSIYIQAAILYLLLTALFVRFWRMLERRAGLAAQPASAAASGKAAPAPPGP